MMDIKSYQSIEQQLNEKQYQTKIQKGEYLRNLKSECLYRQNALKTAENLIKEYENQNQELKLQVMRLNQKIEIYEERVQILGHQLEEKGISNVKVYQKQLFKSSSKLTQVLEKYSQLQEKYNKLQKQFFKLKQYKKQHEQRILRQQSQKQKQKQKEIKYEIQRQFNNFLKTPKNTNVNHQTNASTGKKSFSNTKNLRQLHINDFESSSEKNVSHEHFQETSNDSDNQLELPIQELFHRSQSIKQSTGKSSKMHKKQKPHHFYIQQAKTCHEQQQLIQRLKIMEWKVKQKDEEIMLMLRRNKQIESKYSILKEILEKHQRQSQFSEEENLEGRYNKQVPRNKKVHSTHSKPTDISNGSNRKELNYGSQLNNSPSPKKLSNLQNLKYY